MVSEVHTSRCSRPTPDAPGASASFPQDVFPPGSSPGSCPLTKYRACLCAGTSDVGGTGQGSESPCGNRPGQRTVPQTVKDGGHFEGSAGLRACGRPPGLWLGAAGCPGPPPGALHDLGVGRGPCGPVGSAPGWPGSPEVPPSPRLAIFPTVRGEFWGHPGPRLNPESPERLRVAAQKRGMGAVRAGWAHVRLRLGG